MLPAIVELSGFRARQGLLESPSGGAGEQQLEPELEPELDPEGAGAPEPAPPPPRLPQRATIYIAPDGTVHFGALFRDLVPVADALAPRHDPLAPQHEPLAPRPGET
jgi:hypothetical protein